MGDIAGGLKFEVHPLSGTLLETCSLQKTASFGIHMSLFVRPEILDVWVPDISILPPRSVTFMAYSPHPIVSG